MRGAVWVYWIIGLAWMVVLAWGFISLVLHIIAVPTFTPDSNAWPLGSG